MFNFQFRLVAASTVVSDGIENEVVSVSAAVVHDSIGSAKKDTESWSVVLVPDGMRRM